MDFLTGLILGAIVGVIIDRMFTYAVERHPFVSISPSFGHHVTKGNSLSIRITNAGYEALPPYEVALFNPHRGTLQIFAHESETDRLPGQTDVFTVSESLLLRDRDHLLSWFTKSRPLGARTSDAMLQDITEGESRKWFLRLVVEDSEKVLFENNRVGTAIAEILADSLRNGKINATGSQAAAASISTNFLVR